MSAESLAATGAALRRRLAGGPVRGTFQVMPGAAVTEVLADAGVGFAVVDAEHSAFSAADVAAAAAAGERAGVPVLVRVAGSTDITPRMLDTGVAGLVVPRVESGAEAAAVVRAARFPPLGARGLGPGRASRYGLEMDELRADGDARLVVMVMVETVRGVEAVDEIVRITGIDGVLIGPADLAMSLGCAVGDEPHARAVAAIANAVLDAGLVLGIHCPDAEAAESWESQGHRFVAVGIDSMLLAGATQQIQARGRHRPVADEASDGSGKGIE